MKDTRRNKKKLETEKCVSHHTAAHQFGNKLQLKLPRSYRVTPPSKSKALKYIRQ